MLGIGGESWAVKEQVVFCNQEGEALKGDLHLPSGQLPVPVVVICHGFLGSRRGGGRAVRLADFLSKAGYAVLLFDFAGSGDSEGDFAAATLTKNVGDLRSALNYLEGRGFSNFIVLGRSFGGNAALVAADQDPRVRGVCLWSTPADMGKVLEKILGEQNWRKLQNGEAIVFEDGNRSYRKDAVFLRDLKKYRMPAVAARISPRPLLLVHGTADELVPVDDAQLLFQQAGEPKELVLLPGADHHLSAHQVEAGRATLNWLQQYFNTPG